MSDFVNSGWATYVTVLVIASILFCVFVLVVASKRKIRPGEDPNAPGTTGHVWDDDLVELNNPLPRWWVGLFIITIVFAAGYLALYPGLGTSPGKLGWTRFNQYEKEVAAANAQLATVYAGYAAAKTEDLAHDPKAMAIGERLFVNNCAVCHGSDAKGSKGFPNLTDKDWLGAGTPEYIEQTIVNGREANMPVMAPAVGSPEDVKNVANYVLSLSGSAHNSIAAELGRAKFAACAACHGPDGKGNPVIGAPNLTDKIWLHGWGEEAIVDAITHGKHNVMPPQGSRFTPAQVHVLAAYVWGLSNNPANAAKQ